MNSITRELFAAVRDMVEADLSQLPSVKFLGALRAQLIVLGATPEHAEALAAKVDVSMPAGSLDDAEVLELARLYAQFITQMKAAFASVGVANPDQFVLNLATPLTLKLS